MKHGQFKQSPAHIRRLRGVALAVCCLIASQLAAAHHSRAEFSGESLEIEGAIARTIWANPHPYVVVNARSNNGDVTEWRVEMYGNLFSTERLGIHADSFVPGATLKAAGPKSTRRDGYVLAHNLLFADGVEAVLAPRATARWGGKEVLVDSGAETQYRALRGRVAGEGSGIFRVWTPIYESLRSDLPLTEYALAARERWDELDNFLTRCEQPGMPHTMKTPQEYEFVDEGDTIRIRAQYFDTERTIHILDPGDPNAEPASRLGYSIGRWEGATLVIETTRIDWPYFDTIGTPQSKDVQVTERYTLNEDQSRLRLVLMISDPMTFSRPATIEREWLALGRTIQRYDCKIF